MDLFVGRSDFRGQIKGYGFDLLELLVSSSMPKPATLARYRSDRPDVRYSVRLHPDVLTKGDVQDADVERAREAAEILGADFVVIPSGPRFTPTTRNRELLQRFTGALKGEGRHVGWEPRGLFEANEAEQWAETADALLVRDVSRERAPSGDLVYSRVLPFGHGKRLGQTALERLCSALEGKKSAYVVIDAEGASAARTNLREWLGVEEQ